MRKKYLLSFFPILAYLSIYHELYVAVPIGTHVFALSNRSFFFGDKMPIFHILATLFIIMNIEKLDICMEIDEMNSKR